MDGVSLPLKGAAREIPEFDIKLSLGTPILSLSPDVFLKEILLLDGRGLESEFSIS